MTTKAVSGSIGNTKTTNPFEDKGIEEIIADLRVVIDQIGNNLTNARRLILELAKRFDDNKVYEQDQISSKVKEVLQDKIEEGKITKRWVEKCLPSKYKRKYSKSEQCSLLRGNKPKSTEAVTKKSVQHDKLEALSSENSELKEALKRQTALLTADQISANEIVFTIPKEKYNQLIDAMDISKDFIHLVFDKSGILERAEPDII